MTYTTWKITNEIFAIPYDNNCILYAPLKGAVALVNQAAAKWVAQARASGVFESFPSNLVGLEQVGIIERSIVTTQSEGEKSLKAQPFKPTGVIFLTTSFCNFRCVYCYASASAQRRQVNLDVAKAAIQFAVNNALKVGEETVEITFHGGGEPTTLMPFIKQCVAYARNIAQNNVTIAPSIVTNGYLNESQIQWLGENMTSIQVSLDGPADIHNLQRPLVSGAPTFKRVVRTIQRFIDMGVPNILIKSTISRPITSKMPEIARFLCETFEELDRFHFGPVLEFGRSKKTGFGEPDPLDFVRYGLMAQEVASSYGKHIVISAAQETFPHLRQEFCGLTEPNFAITVDGRVSACYEILEEGDPRSAMFHYGKFENVEFTFDLEKIAQLQRRQHTLAPKCQKCFARWQCAGDCQIRWYDETTGNYDDAVDFRCVVNRELIKHELLKLVQQSDNGIVSMPAKKASPLSYVVD